MKQQEWHNTEQNTRMHNTQADKAMKMDNAIIIQKYTHIHTQHAAKNTSGTTPLENKRMITQPTRGLHCELRRTRPPCEKRFGSQELVTQE